MSLLDELIEEKRLEVLEQKMIEFIKLGILIVPKFDQRKAQLKSIAEDLRERKVFATEDEIEEEFRVLAFYAELDILNILEPRSDSPRVFQTRRYRELEDIIKELERRSCRVTNKELVLDALFQLYINGLIFIEEKGFDRVLLAPQKSLIAS